MAIWEINNGDGDSNFIDTKFEDIQLLFLNGKVKNMYQLVKRSPTKIAELLGMNYDAYHGKLLNPEKFTVLHIYTLALAFKIDPNIIFDIIQAEVLSKVKAKVKKFEAKN